MKRFLYILLLVSISFNLYVFSKIGYNYYQQKKWERHYKAIEKITFKEGYQDFVYKFHIQYPEAPQKEYTYISFSGDIWPWHPPYIDDEDVFRTEDSASIRKNKAIKLSFLLLTDSLASIYNKNVSFVYAYEGTGKRIDKTITENKNATKNILFVNDVEKLLKGYENDKKQFGRFVPTTFIVNKTGKIVFQSNIMNSNPEKKLIKFLKSIE